MITFLTILAIIFIVSLLIVTTIAIILIGGGLLLPVILDVTVAVLIITAIAKLCKKDKQNKKGAE